MTRTFLVSLNLTDTSDMPGLAQDISDDLNAAGHNVISVHPWGTPLESLQASALGILPQNSPAAEPPIPPQQ